jgi:hypothetical protein
MIVGTCTDASTVAHGFQLNSGIFSAFSGHIAQGFAYNGSTFTTVDSPGATNTTLDGIN